MLNATGVLAPATSWVSVAVSNVSDPGAFGPAFRARASARGRPDGNFEGHPGVDVPSSQADIEPTGRAWELLEATRVFDTRGAGEEAAGEAGMAGWNSTLKAAGGVPKRQRIERACACHPTWSLPACVECPRLVSAN